MKESTADRLWPLSGLAFVVLFLGGLLFADVLAGRPFPGIDDPLAETTGYFRTNGAGVRLLSLFHSLAAMALLAFTAYMNERNSRRVGESSPLVTLAFGGGVVAAAFLLLSALLFWALARPETAGEPAVARSLVDLSYLAGGVALLLSLSAFIGASSLLALRTDALPAWLGRTGVVTAIVSLLFAATLAAKSGAFGPGGIIAVAAVPPFFWIFAASVSLARASRARQPRAGYPPAPSGGVTAGG